MHRRLLAGLFLLGPLAGAANAAEIVCTPGDMTSTIQSALDAFQGSSGRVVLQGHCTIESSLFMRSYTMLSGPAILVYKGTAVAIYFRGTNGASLRDLVLWSSSGHGLQFDENAVGSRVRDVQINALGGHGFILQSGAGLWVDNVHINGTPRRGTKGFLLNGTWDSLWIKDTVIEEQDSGFRIGSGAGTIGNLWLTNVVMDRLTGVGLHIEPSGNGNVVNVQVMGAWTAGSHAMLLNASETSGVVATIILTNWRGTESPNGVWTVGNVQNLSTSQLLLF